MAMRLALGSFVYLALVAAAFAQPPYGYGGYYHASTAEEGAARGMADIIRSAGAANLLNSEAAKNYEDARSQYFDNRLKGTSTYFELKRMNRTARAETQREPPTSEQIFRINQARTPDRLGPNDLDPVTGAIAWPSALLKPELTQQRAAVEQIFAKLVETSNRLSLEEFSTIETCVQQMEADLKNQIKDIPTSFYTRGSSFLKSLALEARLAAG